MKQGRMVCALMLALVLLCLTACGAGSTMSADREASYTGGAATNGSAQFFDGKYSVMTDAAEPSAPKEKESGQSASGSVYRNSEVKLIRRASLTVQTTQFDQSALAFLPLWRRWGATLSNPSCTVETTIPPRLTARGTM